MGAVTSTVIYPLGTPVSGDTVLYIDRSTPSDPVVKQTDVDDLPGGGGGGGSGTKTYAVFDAMNSQPPASNFATLDVSATDIAVVCFNDTTSQSILWSGIVPEAAVFASGWKIRIHWYSVASTTGGVVWQAQVMNLINLNSNSYDTAATATTTVSGTAGNRNVTEITLTTLDSLAAKDSYSLLLARLPANAGDTMSGDARVFSVEVEAV